tara:strand:- start:3803 stop:4225 length:423 start_codon:yes stop_codon:yes gene_type:complete
MTVVDKVCTSKEEKFAQSLAGGMTQSDAYRNAYDVSKSTKSETINQSCCRVLSRPHVSARVAELRAPIVAKVGITLENHIQRLQDLSEKAEAAGQYSAAIKAEESRGKACGLYVEKVEHTGKDGGAIETRTTITVNLVKA